MNKNGVETFVGCGLQKDEVNGRESDEYFLSGYIFRWRYEKTKKTCFKPGFAKY